MPSSLQALLEGKIDFEGQKATEKITRQSLITFTAVSFILGIAGQSLRLTFTILGITTLITTLLVVPPWSIYNRHPVQWLPVKSAKKE